MSILEKFIDDSDDPNIKEAKNTIMWFYHNNKKLIPDYYIEDFEQDIILTVLESLEKYSLQKGKFSTYLTWCFKTYRQKIITQTTGIKISYRGCKEICNNGIKQITLEEYKNI